MKTPDDSLPTLFENVLSYPQLDTILTVETFIEKHSAMFKRKSLWENLPKKMKYQTFKTILDYLEYSHKIAYDKEKKIVWINYEPTLLKESVGLDE